jgi:hypothetical protein
VYFKLYGQNAAPVSRGKYDFGETKPIRKPDKI